MRAWNPNTFRRSDVAILPCGSNVFGPLPRICKECEELQPAYLPYTHLVITNTRRSVAHLARLSHHLDLGKGGTFCKRLFSFKPKAPGEFK